MQLADFMIMDSVEYIGEPLLRVDSVVFTGGEEGIEHSRAFSSFVAAGEEVIFTADSRRADNVLHQVIVDLNITVGQKPGHVLPAVESVLDGFTDGAGGSNLVVFGLEPLAKGIEGGL